MKVFIGFLGLMTMLQAQPGATTHSSTFDPAILPRGPVIENRLQTPPRRSTITPAQEAQHRAFVPAKGPVGVPQLETPDGRRAPVQILQPLQTAPSVSVQGLQQDLLQTLHAHTGRCLQWLQNLHRRAAAIWSLQLGHAHRTLRRYKRPMLGLLSRGYRGPARRRL